MLKSTKLFLQMPIYLNSLAFLLNQLPEILNERHNN